MYICIFVLVIKVYIPFIGFYTNMAAAEGLHEPIVPVITQIINLSLFISHMPEKLKDAMLLPIIKKALIDNEILKNFRPVSNLAFISKLIEKVVANQMDVYMDVNKLYESQGT